MNSCVMCWYETGTHHTGNFMHEGNSLCSRHLNHQKPPESEPTEEGLDGLTIKWSKGPDDK